MKKLILVFVLSSFFSVFAEQELGSMFYNTPVVSTEHLYNFWAHIKKDKDDILDRLVVLSYEKPERLRCEYFRDLSFDMHLRFTQWNNEGATFILQEPCKSLIPYKGQATVWILGYVSYTGFIRVFGHSFEPNYHF